MAIQLLQYTAFLEQPHTCMQCGPPSTDYNKSDAEQGGSSVFVTTPGVAMMSRYLRNPAVGATYRMGQKRAWSQPGTAPRGAPAGTRHATS